MKILRKYWKLFTSVSGGVIVLVLQLYFFPNAGKKMENKISVYEYQYDFWSNEVYTKFNDIRDSQTYTKTTLSESRKITPEFLNIVVKYHYQIQQLLRVMGYQANVVLNLQNESLNIMREIYLTESERNRIRADLQSMSDLAAKQKKVSDEIEKFSSELLSAYPANIDSYSDKEKNELITKRLELSRRLFSDENLMLAHRSDPFKLIRDIGLSFKGFFDQYEFLLKKYNDTVTEQQSWKDGLLLGVAVFIALLSLLKELANTSHPLVGTDYRKIFKSNTSSKIRPSRESLTKRRLKYVKAAPKLKASQRCGVQSLRQKIVQQ